MLSYNSKCLVTRNIVAGEVVFACYWKGKLQIILVFVWRSNNDSSVSTVTTCIIIITSIHKLSTSQQHLSYQRRRSKELFEQEHIFFTVNVSLLSFNLILNLVWRVLINNLSDVWTENWPTKFVGISVSIILLCTDKLCCEMLNGHIHFDVLPTNRLGFNFLLSISSLTGDSYYNFNHISSTCSTRNNSFPLLQ